MAQTQIEASAGQAGLTLEPEAVLQEERTPQTQAERYCRQVETCLRRGALGAAMDHAKNLVHQIAEDGGFTVYVTE